MRHRSPGRRSRAALIVASLVLSGSLAATEGASARQAAKPPVADATQPVVQPVAPKPGDEVVLVTVNDKKITKGDLIALLSQYSSVNARPEDLYQALADSAITRELLKQFLDAQGVTVSEPEIDTELARIAKELKDTQRGDLNTLLADSGLTPEQYREQLRLNLRWPKYMKAQASDQALRDYFQNNIDLFTGAQIKARHILIEVAPDASEEVREAAKKKLLEIKQEIADGKLTFADAANKYSQDESNVETPDGGNLDYFARRNQYIDSFCDAAFQLTPNQVSDPVETEYGYHLILVTDRIKGQDVAYEQIKEQARQIFGIELQEKAIAAQRKASKMTVQPMPADFFPKAENPTLPVAPANTPTPASGKVAAPGS